MKSNKNKTEQIPKSPRKSSGHNLFKTVPCPVCRGKNYTIIYEGKFPKNLTEDKLKKMYRSSSDYALFEQVVRCSSCQTVYLNPRLDPSIIIDAYAEGEDESFIAQDFMRMRTFETALRRLAKKYVITLSEETKILDIGCAGGAFLLAAENLGLSAVGIEPNRWLCDYAQKKHQLDARAGTLADHHFPDNIFDLITLWDVIEHVPNPDAELHEIRRILKPNGLLIVNYPDYSSLPARILGKKWPFWLSVHLTYYTPKTINQHLTKSGYEIQTISPHWQTLELGYVFKRMTPYVSLARPLNAAINKIGMGQFPMTYWIGQTQVVARKVK